MLPSPRLWVRIGLLLRELRLGAALVPALCAVVLAATVFPGPWGARAGPAAAVPVGEVVALRSARSSTFAKADGSFETRLSRRSVNWFDPAEKAWKPIDSRLSVSTKAGVGWESGQNRFLVELADQSKDGLVSFVSHGKRMGFSPVGAAPGKTGSRADGSSGVVYRGVYPEVDVEYAVLPDGLKETIVLRKPGAPSSYVVRLEPEPGDKWRTERLGKNGPWAFFVNGAPEPEFVLLPPTVGDSSFESSRLSDPNAIPHAVNVFPGMASLDVSEQKDGSFLATIGIDEKWLADPERVFPVVIDPTVYSTPDVADGWYDTVNGGNPILESMVSVGPYGVGSPNRMGVLTFDVAAIPPAATVSGASLNMFFENCYPGSCQGNDAGTVRVRRLTAGWSAATPWSAISGEIDATTLAQKVFPYPWSTPTQTWQAWSGTGLTSALQGMVNGSIPNYGFILDESQGNNWNGWWFRSSLFGDPSSTPYLDVTWSSEGVQVDPALSVHSNGAELRWQHYPAGPITGFQRFEIHRSATAGFTPSASTLVATLGDDAWQTYRDTSARPGTFYYRVVTVTGSGSFSSNEVQSLLPAGGEATVTVQPGFISSSAKATHIASGAPTSNYGNSQYLVVGSAGGSSTRTLLQFDMHAVPTGVTVTDAKLELYALQSTVASALAAHRVSSSWEEGGATWNSREYVGGVSWATPGGDYDAGSAGANVGGANVHWESVPLTGLVQDWVNGSKSYLGLILRYATENGVQPTQSFAADGFVRSTALRPKLVVTFEDDSASVAPTVAVSQPQASEPVKGTVTVKAGALDDGSVKQVEFFDGATPIGAADTTAPYEASWVTSGRGPSSLTAKATDDAGNVTTSPAVAVTRVNSAAPATSVTGATSGGAAVLTDDFDRADAASLGSGWGASARDGSSCVLRVVSSEAAVASGQSGWCDSYHDTAQPADGVVQVKVSVVPSADGQEVSVFGRLQNAGTASFVLYQATFVKRTGANDEYRLWRRGSGGLWSMISQTTSGPDLQAGDQLGLKMLGATISLWREAAAGAWAQLLTVSDSTVTGGGRTGIQLRGASTRADDFYTGPDFRENQNGVVDVTASATDDVGVSRVEFYADGNRFATDSSSPYSVSLDTRAFPVYDGAHTLTTRATDADGNATTSTGYPITVANTSGTRFAGTLTTSTPVPAEMRVDPTGGALAPTDDFDRADASSLGSGWGAVARDGGACVLRVVSNQAAIASGQTGWCNSYHDTAQPADGVVQVRVPVVPSTDGQEVSVFGRLQNAGTVSFSVYQATLVRRTGTNDEYRLWRRSGGAWTMIAQTTSGPDMQPGDQLGLKMLGTTISLWRKPTASVWTQLLSVTDATIAAGGRTGIEERGTVVRSDDFYVGPDFRENQTGGTQELVPLTVNLANSSGQSWPAAQVKLRYRWLDAAGTVLSSSQDVSIGADLPAGQNRDVALDLQPPALPAGVLRGRFALRVDLYDTSCSCYFAAKGNKPLETWVTVTKDTPDELGLERYQAYDNDDLGGGLTNHVNLANGNNVVEWTPFAEPGRGLDTVVRLAYNSLEQGSVSPVGNNWSLAISSLTPFGLPLDIHPNAADTAAGRTEKWVGLTDGDGTYHRFTGNATGTYYTAPAGVELYLKKTGSTGWEVWKPDRTHFVYDQDGFPVKVADANGNELTYTLATPPAAEDDPYGLGKRVTTVTDAGGRDFTLTYWTNADTPTAAMRGKLKRITDHTGHALDFTYYEDGNLRKITEQGGPGDDGMPTPDRTVTFAYTNPAGTGPAIGTLAGREDPDPATVQSPVLFSVIDFKGQETQFEYATTGANAGRLTARTNRLGGVANKTTFAYPSATTTTVTKPLSRVWQYTLDTNGRVTQITDPLDQDTQIEWTASVPLNHVRKLTQPSGQFTEYAYNPNGYAVSEKDELGNETSYAYANSAVDANDASGNWETGRTVGHLSQLASVTKPRGNATTGNPTDYKWTFTYTQQPTDTTTGLVKTITDPLGNVTSNTWNANATLASQTLPANGDAITRTTTYNSYDANGLPTKLTDPAGGVAEATYRADGLPVFQRDPAHASAQAPSESDSLRIFYDAFGRERRSSTPKSSTLTPGLFVWQSQTYDPNDNVTAAQAAHYGRGDGNNGVLTTTILDALDRPILVTGPRAAADGGPTSIASEYDAAGRLTRLTKPRGVNSTPSGSAYADDFVSKTDYDLLDRPLAVTDYAVDGSGNVDTANTRVTKSCYDLAGDLRSTTAPKGSAGLASCPNPAANPYVYTTAPYTTKLEYDAAHRLVKTTNPAGNTTQTGYDENGQVTTQTDALGKVTTTAYNDRGDHVTLAQPYDTGRTITTKWEYDNLGDVKRLISPRAYDTASGGPTFTDYVESYDYDALQRPVKTTLPAATGTTQAYLHNTYDPNGRLLWTSLPTTSATAAGVTTAEKTQNSYWDTGAIYTQQDPVNPKQRFDYTAQGWQTTRIPEAVGQPDVLDYSRSMSWGYTPDGLVRALLDDGGERARYDYDADGNMVSAVEATGLVVTGQAPLPIELTYDSLDQQTKVRLPKPGSANWLASVFTHDLHGNRATSEDNREETGGGSTVTAGRVSTFAYDNLDRATSQVDDFATAGAGDDEQLLYVYTDRDELATQTLQKGGTGSWVTEQSSERTYFDNGPLKSLTNKNAGGAMIEQHTLSHITGGVYLNGNRTSDVYQLKGPDAAAPCRTTTCTASWTYDARGRLVNEVTGSGTSTAYTVDVVGNVTTETPSAGGAITRTFNGQQLATQTENGSTTRFLYDSLGNQDCAVKSSYGGPSCPSSGTDLLEDWAYDYKNRLSSYKLFNGSGGVVNNVSWTSDPLDRPVAETSAQTGSTTNYVSSYVGASDRLASETLTGATNTTKRYSYTAFGQRATLADGVNRFGYLYDPHGSVSLLTDQAGVAKASYGYTAYGKPNAALTKTAAGFSSTTNSYGYTGKRSDVASGTLDMGARRYSPATGRFLQYDAYQGALDNLGLSVDLLTANRYVLAAGNPVNFVEIDGHNVDAGGASGDSCGTVCQAELNGPGPTAPPPAGTQPDQDDTGGDGDGLLHTITSAATKTIGVVTTGARAVLDVYVGDYYRCIRYGNRTACVVAVGTTVATIVLPTTGAAAVKAVQRLVKARRAKAETEVVQRAMSQAELEATLESGLVRGGRPGIHHVSDAVNADAKRARQRLALPQTPELRVDLEVPKGVFGPPSPVPAKFGMPGGGRQRTATGPIRCSVVVVRKYC